MKRHLTRLLVHAGALFVEAVGTLFLYFDIKRLNSRAPANALGSFGDSVEYQRWYYHAATFGFALVFGGILLAGVCLWLEHRDTGQSHFPEQGSKGTPR
jgi:hypothetical protein